MVKGEILYKNGDAFYGELKSNGQMSGQGLYKFSNGSTYEGFFDNNLFHGRGKLIDQFNSITIISTFQKGKANGQAKIIYQDQSIYQGEVKEGLRWGKGKYVYAANELQLQFQGSFENDHYCGEGILTYKNGDYCKGVFHKSTLNGIGQFKTKDFHLFGEFKNSCPHGKVKIKYSTEQIYQGQCQNGKKQGYGVYTYPDGSYYRGNFTSDLRQGSGELVLKSELTFNGRFLQDEPLNGTIEKDKWILEGSLKSNQLSGFVTMQKDKTRISVDYSEGKKNGLLEMIKTAKDGREIIYKSSFRKDKQDSCSISVSSRF